MAMFLLLAKRKEKEKKQLGVAMTHILQLVACP
jgi:hypothetical protein